ncbi:MAG: DUF167 domain-containing protein [Nitrospirota bacterium]|nr:DUF167 domain-containing protein [Nitrospirota bacterium]
MAALPADGAANVELCRFLARLCGVPAQYHTDLEWSGQQAEMRVCEGALRRTAVPAISSRMKGRSPLCHGAESDSDR